MSSPSRFVQSRSRIVVAPPLRPLAVAASLLAVAAVATPSPHPPQAADSHAALVTIHEDAMESRRPEREDGLPDHSPAAIQARQEALRRQRLRLATIDPRGWPVGDRVDYLLVRAELAAEEFQLRVVRPWARDPGLAVDLVRRVPYAEAPGDTAAVEQLRGRLRAVPGILERARDHLTRPSAELARMAIRQMERSDGVNQGEPRRTPPPAGVIGWYRDLIGRLEQGAPELVADARTALTALQGYRDWLEEAVPEMTEPARVGLDSYDWYLRNVLLMPYDHEDLRTIAQREKDRARTFLRIERHRNRDLPELQPATSAAEHAARVEEAEAVIRSFMREQELLTIPEGLPERFETDAFWIEREDGTRHFWEEITYRDPLNNHLHASIPGHRLDALMQRREERPIRRDYRDGVRAEGWAFYIEEMFLQAGLLEERPRTKELFYIAQLKRAARIPAELRMQTGEYDLADAIDYLIEQVPLMEPDLARYDLQIYLRRPTYGMNYVMGKVQLEKLLSDRALQLGDEFDLGEFHDAFLRAGPIPISLIRWEMTGLDDEVRQLWEPTELPGGR